MKRITYQNRKILEKLLQTSMSKRKISRELGFSHSTILYEIQNHSSKHARYEAATAQVIYEKNQLKKGNIKKINNNIHLKNYILKQLRNDLSPEQIAGRLRYVTEDQKESGNMNVCHETIYSFIYGAENARERYWLKLMRHRPKRIKAHSRRYRKGGTIKGMVSISQRSKYIEKREEVDIGKLIQ
jgi:transposase, IS30 family